MNVFAWILGIILAAGFGVLGATKVVGLDPNRVRLGYSKRQFQLIGLSEVAAAVGVIIGVVSTKLEWVGLAASVGLGTLMMGALIAHARVADDGKKIVPALVMLLVAIAYMIVVSLR